MLLFSFGYFSLEMKAKIKITDFEFSKYLEKGKLIDKEWNKNTLLELMNDFINFENNTEEIKKMNIKMEKNYLYESQ